MAIANPRSDRRNAPNRSFPHPVYVARPLLPDFENYAASLREVWSSAILTNAGPKARALESELSHYLGVDHTLLFNNGTIALMLACRALRLRGKVIVTPFTFQATPHVLAWLGVEPIFVDIDPDSMTIDPAKIEAAITPDTTGILGVHVYGNPCDVQAIDAIGKRRGLKVVYDAAHAFGTCVNGTPIGQFGDATMYSLHATKLFHTAEGGAVAAKDAETIERMEHYRNFGIVDEFTVKDIGINGKMSELNASLGLCVLPLVEGEKVARRARAQLYNEILGRNVRIRVPEIAPIQDGSFQYYCVRLPQRNRAYDELRKANVFARKYFYPLCSNYDCYKHLHSSTPSNLPIANRVSEEVLCLPFHSGLSMDDVEIIASIVSDAATA